MQLFGRTKSFGQEDTIVMDISMFRGRKCQNQRATLLLYNKPLNNMALILLVWLVLKLVILLMMPTLQNKMEIQQLCNCLLLKCSSPRRYSIKLIIGMVLLITKMSNTLMPSSKTKLKIK